VVRKVPFSVETGPLEGTNEIFLLKWRVLAVNHLLQVGGILTE